MSSVPFEKAIKAITSGDYQEGERLLTLAIEAAPQEREARSHRAWLYLQTGRYEKAADDYRIIKEGFPEEKIAVLYLAQALAKQGMYDEAMKEAAAFLASEPASPLAVEILAYCHRAIGLKSSSLNPENLFSTPHVEPLNPVLKALEDDPQSSFPTSIFPQLGRFLYTLTRAVRPKIVIETGCFIGYSTICLCQALRDENHGHLHGFDLFAELPERKYVSPILGKTSTFREIAPGHLAQAGLSDWVTFHEGDSSTNIRKAFSQLKEKADLAFIDGDHTIKGAIADFEAVDEFLNPMGIIVLHDTSSEGSDWLGPEILLEKLDKVAPDAYGQINIPTLDNLGLGLLQKRPGKRPPAIRPTMLELYHQRLFHKRKFWK